MNGLLENEMVWKLATPVVSYVGTAIIKAIFGAIGKGIPAWLKPIIAGLLGTAQTVVSGVPPVEGFILGGGAPMVNEVVAKVTGKSSTGNA